MVRTSMETPPRKKQQTKTKKTKQVTFCQLMFLGVSHLSELSHSAQAQDFLFNKTTVG